MWRVVAVHFVKVFQHNKITFKTLSILYGPKLKETKLFNETRNRGGFILHLTFRSPVNKIDTRLSKIPQN